MNFEDTALTSETLWSLYASKGYNDTRISLELALEHINAKIAKLGDTPTRKQLNELKAMITDEITASYGGLFEQVGQESVQSSIITNAPYLLEFSTAVLPQKTLDYLISGKREILGYEFKDLFKLTEENHIRQLRVTLASGVSQGMPTNQIIREMGIKNEALTKNQLYSAVQSTISDARMVSLYDSYEAMEKLGVVIGYEFDATLDGRTSEICRENDHRRFFGKVKDMPNKPKLHFRCRSTLKPITSNEYQSETRASMDGVIKNQSYGEWFQTKDAAFQLKVLGRTKYDAYKKGIYKVNGIADLKPRNSLPISDMGF